MELAGCSGYCRESGERRKGSRDAGEVWFQMVPLDWRCARGV